MLHVGPGTMQNGTHRLHSQHVPGHAGPAAFVNTRLFKTGMMVGSKQAATQGSSSRCSSDHACAGCCCGSWAA